MTNDANTDDPNPDDPNPGDPNRDDVKPDDVNLGDTNAADAIAPDAIAPDATVVDAKPGDAAFAEDPAVDRGAGEPTLIVDVEGFEGPLDLLLVLARQQKVDLSKISILALANQYLAFIEQARRTRLELAADYLVMAAWLAYLKSRMLLPEPVAPEGMSAADMAKALALRLQRLEAIREAGTKLFERPLLGRDVFGRGDPQPIAEIKRPEWSATLYDLLSAYASERQRKALARVRLAKRVVWSLADARSMLERLVGTSSGEWGRLDEYLLAYAVEPAMRATALASSLAATLELVREGAMEVHQSAAFAPIYLRKRVAAGGDGAAAAP
jgi:segregation and condensation protein A